MRFSRRGQATIWVLVALVIVVALAVLFFLRGGEGPKVDFQQRFSPQGFLERCVRENVEDVIEVMGPRGGFVAPQHSQMFDGQEVTYHCYTRGNYLPCVQQHPMLLREMAVEIKNETFDEIQGCYGLLEQEVGKRQGSMETDVLDMNVALARDRIIVELLGRTTISIEGGTVSFDSFEVEVMSPLTKLANVAMEIASQEAKYCYFSYDGYQLLYPRFDIRKTVMGDDVRVYTIEDKPSKQKFSLAIRSCAIPPGI
ncbi:hypothetical protein CMI48_02045 [Candidatus Pacearchaeota archaeon]|nr:hypothetical protein [Candidatus Pacearchaeota archaeon]